jgi:hypothetical protein
MFVTAASTFVTAAVISEPAKGAEVYDEAIHRP